MTRFVFAICQPASAGHLKAEVAREHPTWRFAYSRPGLLTFKTPDEITPDVELRSVFARVWGLSLGAVDLDAAQKTWTPTLTHVFPREEPEHEPVPEVQLARPGDLVLDVILAPPPEPAWLGLHRHTPAHHPWPGGRPPISVPPDAPSRAFAKIEEAIVWSGAPVRPGQLAVEIGSAPGGAAYALLRRGVHVTGVDPGDMDAHVLAFTGPTGARLTHLRTTLGDVRREALPPRVDWLLLDVNLAPQVALHQVKRLVAALRPTLRGVVFTLKLNDDKVAAQIPDLIRRVEGMAMTHVRATQLPSNRQEICVYGILDGWRS